MIYQIPKNLLLHHKFEKSSFKNQTSMSTQKFFQKLLTLLLNITFVISASSQTSTDPSLLNLDRLFASGEFRGDFFGEARWMDDGAAYTTVEPSELTNNAVDIVKYETLSGKRTVLIPAASLVSAGETLPLDFDNYEWSENKEFLLIFTNTSRVWRANTKGDYWVLEVKTNKLWQLGKDLPSSSLMFAKFSPDNSMVAYVCKHNLFVEDLTTGKINQITNDSTENLINGTFDWAYEEEFFCRDGFKWSPDSKHLAYWQVDATDIPDFLMINNTDSLYSFTIPVEYPKVGVDPSSAKIGVVSAKGGETVWMKIPGDPKQNYLPRMIWSTDSKDILVQQLNRKQNTNKIWLCKTETGLPINIFTDHDEAWLDLVEDWVWLEDGKTFTWISEKDGWRHIYLITKSGDSQKLITPGNYDVLSIEEIDTKNGFIYFIASPNNPTQRYLYRINLSGGEAEMLTPAANTGTHTYQVAPGGNFAFHTWSDFDTPRATELVNLPKHKSLRALVENQNLKTKIAGLKLGETSFFDVTTPEKITMQGFMIKPPDFDPSLKYPVLFYVYGEPWNQTVLDAWGRNNLWYHMLAQQGYIIISIDNRGTPAPKGREWRKCIYRKIGVLNSYDQAMAANEIKKWSFVDSTRLAVWGWSGGGTMTLNLMFRYPEIYSAGMSVAPVSNQFYYDNIYQERYMGLKSENPEDFIEGSPITYAKNLRGDLLIVHGTGDDNVHYQNTEALINELILHNRQFQVMPYPNRSHGIYEGKNTTRHVYTLLTNYLMDHVKAGGITR